MFYVAIVHDYESNGVRPLGAFHTFNNAKEIISEWFGDDYYCEDDVWIGNEMRIYFVEGISHEVAGYSIIYKVDRII